MKTKYFFLAAAAALFAACSSDDGIAEQQQAKQQAEQVPVDFSAYVGRSTTTRAGLTGELKNEAASLQTSGFGVFAYYTNADNYDQTFQPNFMYNQRVTYSSSTWVYTPVKYWPNEFGSKALSDDVDKVSFFAYAPYVTVNPTSGKVKDSSSGANATYDKDNGDVTMGIVGMTRNNATGDPMVKYISTFYTNKQVDLVWGTVKDDAAATTWAKKNGDTQSFTAGTAWLNVEHPSGTSSSWNKAQKVAFQFEHGLAALVVTVDTKVNSVTPATFATGETAKSKVFIRSVTFEGFDTKGALNLNNGSDVANAKKALWYNFDCLDELNNGSETTIKDGRKDGKEGVTPATKEYALINPTFVQSAVFGSTTTGVTADATNLFAKYNDTSKKAEAETDAAAPVYVIPNNDKLKVTIEYDVLTKDDNLVGKLNDGVTSGSVVKNVITRYISTSAAASTPNDWGTVDGESNSITLENGKKYTINLHLGLNSVEFDAAVSAWIPDTGGADLPHNNPVTP